MDAKVTQDAQGRRHVQDACAVPCSIARGMQVIGGASKKMTTERLRQLRARGLVTREVVDTAPVSVQYEITDLGRTALGFLEALRDRSDSLPPEVAEG